MAEENTLKQKLSTKCDNSQTCSNSDDDLNSIKTNKNIKEQKNRVRKTNHYSNGLVLSDIINYSENRFVLMKFLVFALLIMMAPIVLILLHHHFFPYVFQISRDVSLIYSVLFSAVYIVILVSFYVFLAFKEEGCKNTDRKMTCQSRIHQHDVKGKTE